MITEFNIHLKLWLIIIAISGAVTSLAQDPVYSQFYSAPLQLNPAFTGTVKGGHVALNYRNQWPSISKAYETYSLSASKFFNNLNSGFGLSILSDDAGNGLYKTTHVDLTYSYRIQVKYQHYINGGIQVGYGQSRVDWDGLVFFDQIDPQFGPVSPGGTPFPTEQIRPAETSSSYIDIGMGALYYGPIFYAGVTLLHLNTPNDNFLEPDAGATDSDVAGLPLRWSVHGGAEINIGRTGKNIYQTYFAPHFLFVKQKDFWQVDVGAHLIFQQFGFGLSYRHAGTNPDAIIPSAFFQAGAYKIGYSYDVTVSELAVPSGGAHEISFSINFEKFSWFKEESRYNDCLNLFR